MDKFEIIEIREDTTPPNAIHFSLDGEVCGTLSLNDNGIMSFDGNVNESAKVLFDLIAQMYNNELSSIRQELITELNIGKSATNDLHKYTKVFNQLINLVEHNSCDTEWCGRAPYPGSVCFYCNVKEILANRDDNF